MNNFKNKTYFSVTANLSPGSIGFKWLGSRANLAPTISSRCCIVGGVILKVSWCDL